MSHWQGLVKLRSTDRSFSKYIRTRDRKCQFGIKCHPVEQKDWGTGELDIKYLDCVHYFGRSEENTRFDPINCQAGCKKCHDYLHKNEKEFDKIMLNKLGQTEYDKLCIRAWTYKKRDDKLDALYIKQLEKELRDR
jgi:hypothetical protein